MPRLLLEASPAPDNAVCIYIYIYIFPYRLALMLALTFAPCVLTFAPCTLTFASCTLTFAPCAYGVSLLSTGATIPLAQMVVVTSCNLRWWCFILQPLAQIVHLHTWWFTLCNLRWWCFFIHPLAQILHLHSGNLHCVVVVVRICGSGGMYMKTTRTLGICTVWCMVVCGGGSCIMWKWRIYININIYINIYMHDSEYLCMLSRSQWQLASPEPVSS